MNSANRTRFLDKALFYSKKYCVQIRSLSIMSNHYHFVIKQSEDNSGVQQFFKSLQQSYAIYYNLKYNREGPVFGSRYKANLITDNKYYEIAMNYVLKNPLKE